MDDFWNSKAEKRIGTKIFWGNESERNRTHKTGIIRRFSADGDYMVIKDTDMDMKVEVGELNKNKVPAEKWLQVSPNVVTKANTNTPAEAEQASARDELQKKDDQIAKLKKELDEAKLLRNGKDGVLSPEQLKKGLANLAKSKDTRIREYQKQLEEIISEENLLRVSLLTAPDDFRQGAINAQLAKLDKQKEDINKKLTELLSAP